MTDYLDAATIAGVTTLSPNDVAAYLAATTVAGKTNLISDERGPFNDSGTITTVTTPAVSVELQSRTVITLSGSPTVGYPLTATIEIILPTEVASTGGFSGSGVVVGGDTGVSFVAPAGSWGSLDTDNGII